MSRRSKRNEAEEPLIAHVLTDTIECVAGWRARTIHWPASGLPEVYECQVADPNKGLALQRARILATLRYPATRTLH